MLHEETMYVQRRHQIKDKVGNGPGGVEPKDYNWRKKMTITEVLLVHFLSEEKVTELSSAKKPLVELQEGKFHSNQIHGNLFSL